MGTVLLLVVTVAGCGSAGVHTQDPTDTVPTRPLPSTSTTDSAVSGSPSPSWTPPPYGEAQPAVDAYLALSNAADAAFRDPEHASTGAIDRYSDGQAKYAFDQSLQAAKQQGIAYRGTPASHRITVKASALGASVPTVTLKDCGLISATDPYIAYYVATGRAVPTSTPEVPPPYAKTIKVIEPNHQAWLVISITTDATKTCQP